MSKSSSKSSSAKSTPKKDNRPRLLIFIKPESDTTEQLLDFLAEHIDQINVQFRVKMIKVSRKHQKGLALAKKFGVTKTPSCIRRYEKNGKTVVESFVHIRNIIRFLLPRVSTKDHYGLGNTSSDDMIHKFQDKIIATGDESEDDSMDDNNRRKSLQARMSEFQSKRSKMAGVDKENRVKGGRPISDKKIKRTKFDNDDDFLKRVDNVESTPVVNYENEQDGDMMLEDYYNKEADSFGRKHKNGPGGKISRRG